MALVGVKNNPYNITDVVSHEIIPFSRKVLKTALAQDVVPGSVIDESGALVTGDSNQAFVVLEYVKASSEQVSVLVGGTNIWYKKFALQAADKAGVDKAVLLLLQNPAVRFSDAPDFQTT
ncbi:hypothetical protein [Erwinia mallotivora]|uniref:Uncharacterized protein n=1 Tax=Erwinia mallotivora TaxID=69222 RepID=A0A014LWD1_9GAMM|nr:hypothetical protein [Erwinia mallotivora]EXU73881.1 hypothetical protein BG55_20470 [Erwinia mallotivora]